jgi:hypothetical protein
MSFVYAHPQAGGAAGNITLAAAPTWLPSAAVGDVSALAATHLSAPCRIRDGRSRAAHCRRAPQCPFYAAIETPDTTAAG